MVTSECCVEVKSKFSIKTPKYPNTAVVPLLISVMLDYISRNCQRWGGIFSLLVSLIIVNVKNVLFLQCGYKCCFISYCYWKINWNNWTGGFVWKKKYIYTQLDYDGLKILEYYVCICHFFKKKFPHKWWLLYDCHSWKRKVFFPGSWYCKSWKSSRAVGGSDIPWRQPHTSYTVLPGTHHVICFK